MSEPIANEPAVDPTTVDFIALDSPPPPDGQLSVGVWWVLVLVGGGFVLLFLQEIFLGCLSIAAGAFMFWLMEKKKKNLIAGMEWFALSAEARRQRHLARSTQMSSIERAFANVATDNHIETLYPRTINMNGRRVVEVTVKWGGDQHSKLFLYRATGDMLTDVQTIRQQGNLLEWQKPGEPIRYVDAKVKPGETYNYYAWIERPFWGKNLALDFDKKVHLVEEPELELELEDEEKERSPMEEMEDFLDGFERKRADVEEAKRRIAEKIEGMALELRPDARKLADAKLRALFSEYH